jgi:anaerobic carbon-monoxide dehydrogenase iron sulfur subunit
LTVTPKVLIIDPFKCDGCKECEKACASRHAGYRRIAGTRIEVKGTGTGDENFFVPFACQQCVDPPCMAVCPKNAITRDLDLGRVVLDIKLCVGCKMCVSACPTGSMTFAHDFGYPYKCELCDGDPQCVRVCEKKALEYVEPHRFQRQRAEQMGARFYGALTGGTLKAMTNREKRTDDKLFSCE